MMQATATADRLAPAAEKPPLLSVDKVTLRYKTPDLLITATEDVSFNVRESDRFVLLGPSGCGKSTLLKAVGGYMTPSSGSPVDVSMLTTQSVWSP